MSKNSFSNGFAQDIMYASNEETEPLPIPRSPSPNSARGASSLNSDRAFLSNSRTVADSRGSSRKHNRNRTIFPLPLSFVPEENETGPSPVKASHKMDQHLRDGLEDPIFVNENIIPQKRSTENWMKIKRAVHLFKYEKK